MGFGRDKSVDSGGFRGIIPDNSTVPVAIVGAEGKFVTIRNGENAGKVARIYSLVLEVIRGKYAGGRLWPDVWCNVQPDPSGGDDEVFGSHAQFCDICDAGQVYDEDGNYIVPSTDEDLNTFSQKLIGIPFMASVGIRTFKRNDGSVGEANTLKTVIDMSEDQVNEVKEEVAFMLEREAKRLAKQRARDGASGFEDEDGNSIF